MKRTRAVVKIQQLNTIEDNQDDKQDITEVMPKVILDIGDIGETQSNLRPKLNFKSLRNLKAKTVHDTVDSHNNTSSKKSKNVEREAEKDIAVKKKEEEELKPNTKPGKGKLRAVVDLRMMKEELSQLEDPPVTPWEKELTSNRLQYEFFDNPCEELAQRLLGKILVRYLENGTVLKGRIVETEGYLGTVDKASHTYQNKVTPRNLPMYMPPGTIYIYMTYGMYHCFNISSQGDGCAVLIRAIDPLEGIEHMADQRKTSKSRKLDLKQHELCNGPSKLCMAYQLHKKYSKYSICTWKGLWIEDDNTSQEFQIVKSARIGIDSCGPEWANKLLRYYIYGNKSVSKRDKKAEMDIS